MSDTNSLMNELEASNWNQKGSNLHIFNSQEELNCYLKRSKNGNWWRESYGLYDFEQCLFKFNVIQWAGDFDGVACFKNAHFNAKVTFKGLTFKENADFNGCTFAGSVDFSETVFEKEFYPSSFYSSVNFKNAIFKKFVNFWGKQFKSNTDFSFSKFKSGVDFENSIFNEDLYINNSTFNNSAYFTGVEFIGKVNGWNINCLKNISFEWANFRFKVNLSELKVKDGQANFHGTNFEQNAYFYGSYFNELDLTKSVIEKGVYFLDTQIEKSNRETFRIIKHEFIKQNNRIESLKYHSREMKEYEKELFGSKKDLNFAIIRFLRDLYHVFTKGDITNKFIVFINRISNGYNDKPFRGISFTLLTTVFFYLIFLFTIKLENNIDYSYSIKYLGTNFKQILQLLNIGNWDYKPFNLNYDWAYGILVISRIIIGFGIYQTVQAFRKFGRL